MLVDLHRGHMAVSVIAGQPRDRLDLDLIGSPRLPAMTVSETLNLLRYGRPTNPQATECGAPLRDLLREPVRIQGRISWRVPLSEAKAADLACVPAMSHPRATGLRETF